MTHSYEQLAQALQQGAAVLAIVTATRGSVPREVGAKMIIGADGSILNTIGGGAGEAKVIQQALHVLETGEKQWVEIDLGSAQREGVCGGWMQVWLERWSGEAAIALVQRLLDRLHSGAPTALVVPFAVQETPYLAEASSPLPTADRAFVDWLRVPPTLLIVGAGHVGEQLAKVAHLAGFQIIVQDDRPEWANAERYPQAALICTEPIAALVESLAAYTDLYIALVTRGYRYDIEALRVMLQSGLSWTYLGMIGSERRVRMVYRELQQAEISPQRLHAIHAPIGIDIGALTPEEIAISIGAELIQVRRGGSGRSLSAGVRRSLSAAEKAQP